MTIVDEYLSESDLAIALINIPSVTGSEMQVLEFIERQLSQMGLSTDRQHVEEGRWNIFAGWSEHVDIAFCTHVDTVPPFFPARLEGDRLYGRGACDTKGIIAAMLSAGRRLIAEGDAPAFLFLVGEETDSIGAKQAAQSNRAAEHIIVGEPTDNALATGHKGVVSYTLTTEGVVAHSAYPERGRSAIHLLLDILDEIRAIVWEPHPVLGEPTLNIGMIRGGVAMNTLAPEASATLMHRIVNEPEAVSNRVLEIVGDRAMIDFHSQSRPQILTKIDGFPCKPVSFGTDIPYLDAMGKCLLLGPGSIHDAHTETESISLTEMSDATDLYVRLFHSLRHI